MYINIYSVNLCSNLGHVKYVICTCAPIQHTCMLNMWYMYICTGTIYSYMDERTFVRKGSVGRQSPCQCFIFISAPQEVAVLWLGFHHAQMSTLCILFHRLSIHVATAFSWRRGGGMRHQLLAPLFPYASVLDSINRSVSSTSGNPVFCSSSSTFSIFSLPVDVNLKMPLDPWPKMLVDTI